MGSTSAIPGRGCFDDFLGDGIVVSPLPPIVETLISAIYGPHKANPVRDSNEQTRSVITPSVLTSQPMRPHFVQIELAYCAFYASLAYTSDDVVPFQLPPSPFSQWTPSPFIVDLVGESCAEQFMMTSKACLCGDDLPLSVILAPDSPREQNHFGR